MISITIPLRIESTLNKREHWSIRANKNRVQRTSTWWALQGEPLALPGLLLRNLAGEQGRVKIKITRIAPRKLDSDNLVGGCKAIRDGVSDWLGIDDRSDLLEWIYAQEKGKEYAARIEVEAI